jgi:glyoxylase-like metal-dependent hydrolase (beta-lactamase superfamily II)
LAHLSTATRVEDWDYDFPASLIGARPTVLVTAAKTLSFDGQTINIGYYGPAHTDGDLSVYFVQADVLLTGDTYWNGYYPFIDRDAGGSIGGMIRAAEANIKRAGDNTIVVPGHGPVARRADRRAPRRPPGLLRTSAKLGWFGSRDSPRRSVQSLPGEIRLVQRLAEIPSTS